MLNPHKEGSIYFHAGKCELILPNNNLKSEWIRLKRCIQAYIDESDKIEAEKEKE